MTQEHLGPFHRARISETEIMKTEGGCRFPKMLHANVRAYGGLFPAHRHMRQEPSLTPSLGLHAALCPDPGSRKEGKVSPPAWPAGQRHLGAPSVLGLTLLQSIQGMPAASTLNRAGQKQAVTTAS